MLCDSLLFLFFASTGTGIHIAPLRKRIPSPTTSQSISALTGNTFRQHICCNIFVATYLLQHICCLHTSIVHTNLFVYFVSSCTTSLSAPLNLPGLSTLSILHHICFAFACKKSPTFCRMSPTLCARELETFVQHDLIIVHDTLAHTQTHTTFMHTHMFTTLMHTRAHTHTQHLHIQPR